MNQGSQNQVDIAAGRPIVIYKSGLAGRWFKNLWMGARGQTNPVVAFIDENPISFFHNGVDGIPVIAPTSLLPSYSEIGRPFIFLPLDPSSAQYQQLLLQHRLQPNVDFAAFPAPPDYTIDWLAFYPNWNQAQADTVGYEDKKNIDEHVQSAKQERQLPPSYQISYADQRLLTPFAFINDELHTTLRIVDFGGAMGAHFLRFKAFMPKRKFEWYVWETEAMAKAGDLNFGSEELRFVYNANQIGGNIDVVIASSSLQYVPDCLQYYEKLNALKPKFFLIDRTPLAPWSEDRILVQRVIRNTAHGIFETSYPSWFLSDSKWMEKFQRDYKIVMRWPDTHDIVEVAGERIVYSGLLLKRF